MVLQYCDVSKRSKQDGMKIAILVSEENLLYLGKERRRMGLAVDGERLWAEPFILCEMVLTQRRCLQVDGL